jgi:murein DD-endopeptidase MepM/ murein hydrolase activator NlpD
LLIAASGWPQHQKFELHLNLPQDNATSQGQTLSIELSNPEGWLPADLQANFAASSLKFAKIKRDAPPFIFKAFQAIDPALAPETYPLTLTFNDKQGLPRIITRSIKVAAHDYGTQDLSLTGDLTSLADHSADDYDNAQLASVYATFSPALLWQGLWQWPLNVPWTQTTNFAQRRVYNGKLDTLYYHGGIDLAPNSGQNGANVHSGAAGKVIYTGSLKARGLSVVVDHGLGVTSYYFHLSQINVKVGQSLESGGVVGLVGSTGRATGPHLDWEVRVNGIITDPRTFLQQDLSQ